MISASDSWSVAVAILLCDLLILGGASAILVSLWRSFRARREINFHHIPRRRSAWSNQK